eukprot:7281006-Heterocapsa_arctica.AAC.1
MAETEENGRAMTDSALAEAKEDLKETQDTLAKNAQFSENLKMTCGEETANFEKHQAARQEDIKAVSETFEILQEDDACDAMIGNFSFVQVSSRSQRSSRRSRATALLRRAAARSRSNTLAALANNVQFDAFMKMTEVIDGMITALSTEQADEVKKND